MTSTAVPFLRLVENPIPERADPACEAASLCPVCSAKLVFRGCKGICKSAFCIHRIVVTCSDN